MLGCSVRGFDADYGCVDDVRVVEKHGFEFRWRDLETADFDEVLR